MSQPNQKLSPVEFTRVTLQDGFWAPRVRTNSEVTVWAQNRHLVKTGRIDGIDPDYRPGDREAHHVFWDSDVAKWLESASLSLAIHPDPELECELDRVIEKFAKLQRGDGYINNWFTAVEPENRWNNLRDLHELYCAGHLMEAAVANVQATGKRRLIDMMCRYADYIDSVFGDQPGKKRGYCGHEEIELALFKLYRATGVERYRNLAAYFVNERGRQPHYYDIEAASRHEIPGLPGRTYEYYQAHLPVREQTSVVGHAVRAMYLYSAMSDLANETGDQGLIGALDRLWDDLCLRKMYVTGGVGTSPHNEGFTSEYDLPEETAYCETCAAIGLVLWNHRLLQREGDGRFADIMERALYNGSISSISLSGDRFFYGNPLASRGNYHRSDWLGCACCPGNISRLVASVGGYAYSESEGEAWVHLYVQGSAQLSLGGRRVVLEQDTRYPWEGLVRITVRAETPTEFALNLRIPGWCRTAEVLVDGCEPDGAPARVRGYERIERRWQDGDTVSLRMDMPVERVVANPGVRMDNGKVALQRGPIVYCLEGVDNPVSPLARISLPRDAQLEATFSPGILGGVVLISGEAEVIEDGDWVGQLYRTTPAATRTQPIQAVPYCVWDNREAGEMIVWIREG